MTLNSDSSTLVPKAYFQFTFAQVSKVAQLEQLIPKKNNSNLNNNTCGFYLLGKYDFVMIKESAVFCRNPILPTSDNTSIKASFSIAAVEYGLKKSGEEDHSGNDSSGFKISETNNLLITLINLYNPIFLKENIEKVVKKNRIPSIDLTPFSRFSIIKTILELNHPVKVLAGLGRNEIILLTNLDSFSTPVKDAYEILSKINSDAILYKTKNSHCLSKAIDSSSLYAIAKRYNEDKTNDAKANLNPPSPKTAEKKVTLITLLSTQSILETFDFKTLITNMQLENANVKPIMGFYDYLISWDGETPEKCLDELIALRTKIELGNLGSNSEKDIGLVKSPSNCPFDVQTYSFLTPKTPSSNNSQNCKNYLNIDSRANAGCERCSVESIKKTSINDDKLAPYFIFAIEKLVDLDTIVLNALNDPSSRDSLRNICAFLQETANKIEAFQKSEEIINSVIWDPLFFPEYFDSLRKNRFNSRAVLFRRLYNIQTYLQQRLSNLQQTKLIGGGALEITNIPMNYEQIILAAEAIIVYTTDAFPGGKFIIKAKDWPSIVIGLDDSFALLPPGLINIPYNFIFDPIAWGGIAHETLHFFYMNPNEKNKAFFKEINAVFKEFTKISLSHDYDYSFLVQFFEDLITDLLQIIILFKYEINSFLISSIRNIAKNTFRWENFARLLLVVLFALYHKSKTEPKNKINNFEINNIATFFNLEISKKPIKEIEKEEVKNSKNKMKYFISKLILDIYYTILNCGRDFAPLKEPLVDDIFTNICLTKIFFKKKETTIFDELYHIISKNIRNSNDNEANVPSEIICNLYRSIYNSDNKAYTLEISKDNKEILSHICYKGVKNLLDPNNEENASNNINAILDLIKWMEDYFLV